LEEHSEEDYKTTRIIKVLMLHLSQAIKVVARSRNNKINKKAVDLFLQIGMIGMIQNISKSSVKHLLISRRSKRI
jgi:DNA-directed RNA polymerase specialized sigma subunit